MPVAKVESPYLLFLSGALLKLLIRLIGTFHIVFPSGSLLLRVESLWKSQDLSGRQNLAGLTSLLLTLFTSE